MKKRKDRIETEERIKEAAKVLLLEDGFGHFGINALAHRAQAEKVLIYRYFKSPSGVIEVIADEQAEAFASVAEQKSFTGLVDFYAHHALLMQSALADGLPNTGNALVGRMREAMGEFAAAMAQRASIPAAAVVALSRAVAGEGGRELAQWADAQLGLSESGGFTVPDLPEELPPELL